MLEDVAERFTASRETIRRDLSALGAGGPIRKFHAGARARWRNWRMSRASSPTVCLNRRWWQHCQRPAWKSSFRRPMCDRLPGSRSAARSHSDGCVTSPEERNRQCGLMSKRDFQAIGQQQ